MKNILLRLKPKGTPPVLTPSLRPFRLALALNPCGCGRCPPASNAARKKPLKTRETLICCPLKMGFSRFFPCSVWAGGEPTAALAERTRDESRQTCRLGDYPIRQAIAHTEQAVFNGFYPYKSEDVFYTNSANCSASRAASLRAGLPVSVRGRWAARSIWRGCS